ncbi:MAG: SRPBCC family protein, partial [Caldimonas sp.]
MLQHVVRSTVIDAPIERVWAVLRDFNSHDQWHGVVAESRIEGDERGDQVGCVRSFTLKDGSRIREQLIALSDSEHKSTYCIVEATVPLQRYVATVTLKPVTDGDRTFWHWESTFSTPPGRERELREMVAQGVYEAGFENLRRHLRDGGDRRATGATPMPVALPLPARRAVVHRYGGPEMLQPGDGEAAAPGAGEVRIRQRAIGVNYLDVYLRKGWIPAMLPLPGVPGMEAVGTVVDVGANANGLLPGDRVACLGPVAGAYASVRTVPAGWVVRLPAGIDDDVAAATLLKGITADVLLRDLGHVGPGTRLLVHAAAGGVGLLVCSWARRLGATVIGTVSSDEKARVAREYGCAHPIVTRE